MTTAPPEPVRLERRDTLVALLLAAAFALGSYFMAVPGVCGVFHDDGVYVATARALAEGQGYQQIFHPARSYETKFPILYPLLLACIWRLWPEFPANLAAMQALSVACGAAAIAFSYLYLVRFRYASRCVAAAAGALAVTAPMMLYFGSQTLSEMPFALLLIAALWAVERWVGGPYRTRIGEFALGLLLAMPFLCRAAGIVVMPAALVLLLRAGARIRWTLAGMTALAAPWVLWAMSSAPRAGEPIDPFYADYAAWWASSIGSGADVVRANLQSILGGPLNVGAEGLASLFPPGSNGLRSALALMVGAAGLIVGVLQAWRGRVLACVLAAYLALVAVWPWPPPRFLAPILPFLLSYPLTALLDWRSAAAGGRVRWALALTIVCAAVACNVKSSREQAGRNARTGYPHFCANGPDVEWSEFDAAFAWLRSNARSGDAVATGLDTMTYLHTGLAAYRPFPSRALALFYGAPGLATGSIDELVERLHHWRARYLVTAPLHAFSEDKPFSELTAEFLRRHADLATPKYTSPKGSICIYELTPAEPAADGLGRCTAQPSGGA